VTLRRSLIGTVAVAAALAVAALPATVFAHALAQSSMPASGATLQSPPPDVTITFGETPDPALSTITVIDTSGRSWIAGSTAPVRGEPLQLEVPLKHLPKGVYTVTWKTVSAVDGHLATGAFAFGVGVSPGSSAVQPSTVSGAAPPSALAVITRLMLYAGLVVVFGSVVLGAAILGTPTRALRRVVAAGCGLAFVGALGVITTQINSAGVPLASVFGSSLGRALLARLIPALALLGLGVLLLVRPRWWKVLGAVAGVTALAAMAVDVLLSHAAAEAPTALNELAQWLHIAAVGTWIGGLVALLAIMVGAPSERRTHAARRLSTLAGVGLITVAATGAFRAVIEVQTWESLVSTAFGALVLLKVGLLVILAGLGALNRFGNLPRLPALAHRLRRTVSIEVLVALGALTVAAALVNVAPPSASAVAATASAQPVVVTGSDFGTSVKVMLTVSPGEAGIDVFTLAVSDYDSGRPVDASQVTVTFTLPNQSVIGTSNLTLRRTAAGVYQARGGNLAVDGTWKVEALIERGANSVEVPMHLTTRSVPPVVSKVVFAGEPTLYNVHLTQGGFVQVYIDPDKAGAVEFHMTFLDQKQQEISITSAAATETARGGAPQNLTLRRLDDIGHFVADANVAHGATRFDMIATTSSGNVISTYLELAPAS
jgi:copper transport protein